MSGGFAVSGPLAALQGLLSWSATNLLAVVYIRFRMQYLAIESPFDSHASISHVLGLVPF